MHIEKGGREKGAGVDAQDGGANIMAAETPSWVFVDQVDADLGRYGSRHSSRGRSRE
jgi:hypothetical protein